MFSLIGGLLKWLCAKPELNVLIVGLDHAGKTTLLEQMKGMYNKAGTIPLDKIPPTIGLNVGKMEIASVSVTFWDLGGQAAMRTMWSRYCADAGGIVFVVDAADRARLAQARDALEALLDHKDVRGIPLLVMANKQDLKDAVSGDAVARALALGTRRERVCKVQGVSALTCEGVHEGVAWLIDAALESGSAGGPTPNAQHRARGKYR